MTTCGKIITKDRQDEFKYSLGEVIYLEMDEVEDLRYDKESQSMLVIISNGDKYRVNISPVIDDIA